MSGAATATLQLGAIRVGRRHRRKLGDLAGLAESIREVGMLQPVVVTSDGRLVAGARRMAAAQTLDMREVPVHVVDVASIRGEYEENEHRKALTRSERVALIDELRGAGMTVAEAATAAGCAARTYRHDRAVESSKRGVTDALESGNVAAAKAFGTAARTVRSLAGKVDIERASAASRAGIRAAALAARERLEALIAAIDAAPPAPQPQPEPEPEAEPDPYADLKIEASDLWERYERATPAAREKAKRCHKAVLAAAALVDGGLSWSAACESVAADHGIGARTLLMLYRGRPNKDGLCAYERADWLAALAPGAGGGAQAAAISPAAWEWIKGDYLRPEQPAVSACYERLLRVAAEQDWVVPSLRTMRRKLAAIPREERVLAREGEHALLRALPAQRRSVAEIPAGAWVNGDGYKHNVFVRGRQGEKPYRPVTWFWQDVHSRRILAWRTDRSENADVIRLSFGELIDKIGIPADVTLDNTRAAANKWMSGGIAHRFRGKVRQEDPVGVFPLLGINVHWTSVQGGKGWGQAKPVERAFGTGGVGEVVDKHPALAGAYCGAEPTAKPENYGERAVSREEFERVLESEIAAWNGREGRRTEACAGKLSFDQAWERSYAAAAVRRAAPEQRRLWLLAAEAVKVQRDAAVQLEAGRGAAANRYAGDCLLDRVGHKVVVRFDPARLHDAVHIYAADGNYVGEAECIRAAGFGDAAAGREHARVKRSKVKAVKAAARADTHMDALEAAALLPGAEAPAETAPAVVEVDFRRGASLQLNAEEEEMAAAADELILRMSRAAGFGG